MFGYGWLGFGAIGVPVIMIATSLIGLLAGGCYYNNYLYPGAPTNVYTAPVPAPAAEPVTAL